MKERLATLISGGGTTMQEIIKAIQSGRVPAMDIACVISSNPNAGGIGKARNLGIPEKDIIVINPDDFRGKDGEVDQYAYGLAILKETKPRGVTVITQNGHMHLTSKVVIDEYKDTIFNQHPGLLPETGGMHGRQVHAAVLYLRRATKGEMYTEVIAQRVHEKFDLGAIVKSQKVDILSADSPEDLQLRALPFEHALQIDLLRDIVRGNVKEIPKVSHIKPGEEQILFAARKAGRLLYPKG